MANQMETDCPWERHWDEGSGLYFYFNPTTETSEWEVPAGWEAYFAERDAEDAATGAAAIPASAEEGGEDTRVVVQEASSVAESSGASATVSPEDDTATTNDSGSGTGGDAHDEEQDDLAVEGVNTLASVGCPAAEADAPPSCAWIKTEDESGNVYYYNQTTEESSWEEPPEYTRFHAASRENEESGHAEAEAVAKMEEDAEGRDDRMEEDGQEEEEEEEDEEEEEEEAEEEEDEEEEEEEEEEKEEEEYSHFPAVVSPITPDANMMAHEHQRQNTGGTAVATRSGSRVRRDYPSPEPDAFGGVRVASPTYDWQGGEGSPSSSPEGSHSFGDSLSPPSGATGWAGYSIGELSPILENIDAAASDLGGLNKEVRWGVGAETLTGKENGKTLTQEQKKEKIQRAKRIAADREHQLDESDAIMEVDCYTRVVEYQNALGSLKRLKGEHNNNKETLNQSMKKLIAGYQGYAQQTLLVNSWLCMASEVQEEDTEDMMVNELKELIKENFDAKKADGILDSGKGVPSWLTAMQADDGWRRTLIELAKEHRGSALLRFVLKQLSDRGHHREIASVISETDLFSVFNGVLKDALARIPADDEEDIDRAMDDLKRMCCSTSYMFMYSQQLLLDLEATARAEAKPTPPTRREETLLEAGAKAEVNTDAKKPACVADDGSNRRTSSRKQQRTAKKPRGDQDASTERRQVARAIAARKFKRLRQELTNHTCDMGGSKGSTGLTNPRQGPGTGSGFPSVAFVTDVERAFSEGSRVLRPPTTAASHAMDAERVASSAVISLLGQVGWKRPGAKGLASGGVAGRRTAVLSEAVEALVSAYGLGAARRAAVEGVAKQLPADDVVRPSALLVRHESVINILLEALFDPTQRSPSEDVKTGSSAILAYASCVEVKLPGVAGGGKGERGGPAKDEVDLVELSQTSHALMQAGNRCFEKRPSRPASLQGRLRPFAEYPVVSLGIMKWIHAQVSTEAFCSTPRFLSDAPMFLKLCKHTVDDHPPQRPEVFEILKYILNARMAPDTPASSRNNLKKQVLLHMADVVMKGYVIPVLAYVHKLAVETSLESSVLGYFVLRIIEAAGPREDTGKYSPAFLNGVGALVGVPRVRQALQGNKLSTLDENRLSNFFRFCMRFQSTDFTKEGMEAIVELRSDLGSS